MHIFNRALGFFFNVSILLLCIHIHLWFVFLHVSTGLFSKMSVWAPGKQHSSIYDKFSKKYFDRNRSNSWVGGIGSALADYIDSLYKRSLRFVRRLMSKKH